jgi:flavin reductase (DIM6/NTAB) family NADH-FMN oxidoreductase RutF
MSRKEIEVFKYVKDVNRLLRDGGLLLVSKTEESTPNVMTIGWGFLGTMWAKPVFVVAVRRSRHTYSLMEKSDSFTVCLPSRDMEKVLDTCGTKSGRDMNKIKELGLTSSDGKSVKSHYIEECPVHYECKIVYKDAVMPGQLDEELESIIYPRSDMHVLYYGEIKGVYATEEADEILSI